MNEVMMNPTLFSAESSQGPVLELNEDKIGYEHQKRLYFVLDGMGGAGIGDVFSEHVKAQIIEHYGTLTQDPNRTMPFFYGEQYETETNALMNALLAVHEKCFEENQKASIEKRGAASGVFCALSERLIHIVSVGATQAYHISDESEFEVLFRPDVAFSSKAHGGTSIPGHGIGLFRQLNYQIREVPIRQGSRLLLATDGVYPWHTPQSLQQFLHRAVERKDLLSLFAQANRSGNQDNQTAVVLAF